ncbi:MAG: LytR C-terminal domain-containing protein, partial [Cyanobacteria bacterium P01_A01_bin.17]
PEEYEYSYWIMSNSGKNRIMESYFDILPDPDAYQGDEIERSFVDSVQISVQNASGDPEGGAKMLEYLNEQGFYRVYLADEWPQILKTTQVIPQWGDLEAAKYVQPLLEESELAVNSTGDLRSDLTIRVGKSWLSSNQSQPIEPSDF